MIYCSHMCMRWTYTCAHAGTSAILGSGERKRHSTMVAVTDVRVVRLGREEFEAGNTTWTLMSVLKPSAR